MLPVSIIHADLFTPAGRDFRTGEVRWQPGPLAFWGEPGTGKTKKLETLGWLLGFDYVHVLTLSNADAAEVGGIPFLDPSGEFYSRKPPEWAYRSNQAKRALVIIDEFGDVATDIQAAAQRVINERYVGDTKLKGSVRLMVLGNPVECSTHAQVIRPAVANRLGHKDLKWDNSIHNAEWLEWLIANGGEAVLGDEGFTALDADAEEKRVLERWNRDYAWARGMWAAFVNKRGIVHEMPAISDARASRAFCTARTSEKAARALAASRTHALSDMDTLEYITAFIGEDLAQDFVDFMITVEIPDVEEWLDGKIEFHHDKSRPDMTTVMFVSAAILVASGKVRRKERAEFLWNVFAQICKTEPDVIWDPVQTLNKHPDLIKIGKAPDVLSEMYENYAMIKKIHAA